MNARGCLLASLLLFAPAKARAQADELEPELPSELQAPFTLIVNHVEKGEITAALRHGAVFVRRADLIAAGIGPLGGEEVEVTGERMLPLASVSPPLHYELDEAEITLTIIAPTDLLPKTTIDLGGRSPDVVYQRTTSGFFNYAPRIDDRGRLHLYEETGANVDGTLVFTSAYLSTEHDPIRGISQVVIDDRPRLQRFTFGDALVTTGALGSGHFVGGATVARAFEIDPYLVKSPSLGFVGRTMTPATLDVYVNGARVRSEDLQPGAFRLENLRVGGGKGVATYVLRDVFGNEQSIEAPFYVSDSVLSKGFADYTYSVGVLRDRVGVESWDYGRPAALGVHRLGLSDHFTLGARAEATELVVSAGPSAAMLTPIGQARIELGASRDTEGGTGFAAYVAYGFVSRWLGAGAFARFESERYATVDQRASFDRAVMDFGVFQAVPIGPRVTFSTQGTLSRYRDRGVIARGSGQTTLRLDSRLSALLSGSASWLEDGGMSWELLASVNCSFDGGHNASLSGRTSEVGPSLLLDASKSLPVGEGYGYRAYGTLSEAESGSANLLAQYQTLYGRYGVQYAAQRRAHTATLEAAGALVVIPGVGLFPTLPVQDGFGVIRVPGVAGVRGYVNNQALGRTDRHGNVLVPNLISYYGNRLGIEPQDVPMQYDVQVTDMTLAPWNRGAVIAEFPVSVPHFYRGTVVVDDRGRRVVPEYGQLRVARPPGEVVSPLGEQGEFEIEGLAAGRYEAWVDYADGSCPLALVVGTSSETFVELGEVTCVLR